MNRHTTSPSKAPVTKLRQTGKLIVDATLFLVALGVIAGTTIPGFKAHAIRSDYTENVLGAAAVAQRALESCLRTENHIGRCKRGKDLLSHGYYPAKARLFDGVDKIEFAISAKEASVFVTPLNQSPSMPSVTDEDDLIITAKVLTDKAGNNRLSPWETDPDSGCAARGLCQ